MRILVADDDPISRLLVSTAVQSLGHQCLTVADGAQAWNAFRSSAVDVVISDWSMPRLTGLELCHKVRAHDGGSYTYFILLTGQGTLDDVLEGMGAGADDYLVKPLDTDDLQARLIAAERVTSLHNLLAGQRTEMEALNQELTARSLRDPLTGLGNRRALQDNLELLESRVNRYGHRYCMALLDIDYFKSYNDTYGHQAGDGVLRAVADQIRAQVRGGDAVYRYGGEEFLCIFPEQSTTTGMLAVQRMRLGVTGLAIPHAGNPRGVLTFSAGLATMERAHPRTTAEVLKEADEALYEAKSLGRNRVEPSPYRSGPAIALSNR